MPAVSGWFVGFLGGSGVGGFFGRGGGGGEWLVGFFFQVGVRGEERRKKIKRFYYLLFWSPNIQDLLSLSCLGQQQFSFQCPNTSVLC